MVGIYNCSIDSICLIHGDGLGLQYCNHRQTFLIKIEDFMITMSFNSIYDGEARNKGVFAISYACRDCEPKKKAAFKKTQVFATQTLSESEKRSNLSIGRHCIRYS